MDIVHIQTYLDIVHIQTDKREQHRLAVKIFVEPSLKIASLVKRQDGVQIFCLDV